MKRDGSDAVAIISPVETHRHIEMVALKGEGQNFRLMSTQGMMRKQLPTGLFHPSNTL